MQGAHALDRRTVEQVWRCSGLRFGLPDHLTRDGQATVKQICYCGLVVKQVPSH